ncbi:MAG: N-acetylmuramoyl-L-alanine amidase [Nocardioides sp.]
MTDAHTARERAVRGMGVALAWVLAAALGLVGMPTASAEPPPAGSRVVAKAPVAQAPVAQTLAGKTVVLDPGHQLGNHNFPAQINALVPAGGFDKPCNTTGTATDSGYAEATFAFRVAMVVRQRLIKRGARVILTRKTNREDRWGPCIDRRGRKGNRLPADLKLSIHGDGSTSGGRGFHVIAPTDRAPWTDDIFTSSRRLARTIKARLVRRGYLPADYIAGGDGIDFRSDLGTLNLSNIPTVMVESGNMRGPDAAWMTTRSGRRAYARALTRAIRDYLE